MMRNHYPLLAGLLVFGHLVLTLAYSAAIPLGEAPDEADHWAYVVYLARERQLPVGPRVTQSKHPPLYHITAALTALPARPSFDFLRSNPDVQFEPTDDWSPNFFIHTRREQWPGQDGALAFRLARGWSILLSTIAVAATYPMMRAAFPSQPIWALTATGFLAFLPQFAFIGGAISNDNAAACCGALALWGGLRIYRHDGRFAAGWWTPLALGCGFLSKVSTLALWPAVGLAVLAGGWNAARPMEQPLSIRHLRATLITLMLVFVPAALLAAPWLLRNWQLYGDPLGMEMARQTVDQRLTPWTWAETRWLLRGWFLSFWGRFGAIGHIRLPMAIYALAGGLTVASVFGLVRQWIRSSGDVRTVLAVLLLATLGTAAAIWRYSLVALGTDQARLLFPAASALAALFVVGLFGLLPNGHRRKRHEWLAGSALVAALIALNVYSLLGVIRPAFAPPSPPPAEEVAQWAAPAGVDFGEIALVGWQLDQEPILYWQADSAPMHDWRTVLRVVGEDGTLVWEWKRSPGRGRYATDRWLADTMVRDAYAIQWPEWAGSGRYRVEVGLRPFGGELVQPMQGETPLGDTAHPYFFLGWLERK